MHKLKLLLFGVLLFGSGLLFAAYLDSDYTGTAAPRPAPQPPPPPLPPVPWPPPLPPPPPQLRNEPAELVRLCLVGQPFHYRGLTVFPLSFRHAPDRQRYQSLDAALSQGWLRLEETGEVSAVNVANLGQTSVFLLAGEILVGGRQNRMVGQDLIVPPRSRVRVPVYCVEKGRWAGAQELFGSKRAVTVPQLRAAAGEGASQDRVWQEVTRQAEAAKAPSRTEDFQAVYDAEHVRRDLADYQQGFRDCWRQRLAGFVVCHHERIIAADLFSDPELFAELREKLFASYALDHLCRWPAARNLDEERRGVRPPRGLDAEDIRRFLEQVQHAGLTYQASPGEGQRVVIAGAVTGTALVNRGVAVHLNLYPGVVVFRE